jgi:hypothetical protein
MAKSKSNQQRQQRSDARTQRRSPAAEPSVDEAGDTGEGGSPTASSLKYAAMAAAAGAAAAAIAGAAKVLVDRRNEEEQQAQEGDGVPPQAEGEPDLQAEGEPEPQAEAEPEPEDEDTEMESPRYSRDEPEARDEGEVPDERQARDEPEPSSDERESGEDADDSDAGSMPQGASADEFTEIVDEAKRKLKEVLGVEPERVSGFDRSNGRSTVTLEVVEVHRVPETTDVLASYEVAFDEDRNLVSMSEVRRYLRAQIEGGR